MAIWEDIDELSDDEVEAEEANLALMATAASDNVSDSESDTDDIEEVISQMSSTQVTKALKDIIMKYMEKTNEIDLFKQKFNLLNEKVNHIQADYQKSLKTIKVLETGCRTCHKPYDEHEIALQEFVHHNIDKTKISSMIYGGSNYKRQGLGCSASSGKGKSSQSVCISKTLSGLYSNLTKGRSKTLNMSDTLVTFEPQDKASEDQTSSDPQSSKTKVPLTSVSRSTQAKANRVLQPVDTRGTNTSKANLVSGSLIYSRGKSKGQYKPKYVSNGSIDSNMIDVEEGDLQVTRPTC
jgi:cytochrome c556